MTDETASRTSQLSSKIAGVFPAPTPIAGFPDEYAARTIAGPPVAKIISASFISKAESSTLGSAIQPIISFGAPAATAASKIILAASMVHPFARGCGDKISPFRVFKQIRALKIAVEVGFVVGITAAAIPIDSAIRV